MPSTFYAKIRRHKPPRREPLASLASHRRSPKRPLHFFKQKSPHDSETSLSSKRSSSTPSDSSDRSSDGKVVYSDTGYPRIDGDHQVVTVDSKPAFLRHLNRIAPWLRLKLDLESNDGHKTHGSTQKRHADNRDKGSREEKKQKQGQGFRKTGGGGGGGDGGNGGGNGGKQPPDGHRYPVPPPPTHSGPQKKPPFACPFHKFDPVRYDCCSSVRLKRPSDVSQHISRCHVLGDVKLKTDNAEHADNAEPADNTESADNTEPADNVELLGNAKAEQDVALYCSKCRMEFFGLTAEANLRQHLPCQTPHPATIEQTGLLLPAEFVKLSAARKKASGDIHKWNAMWKVCFPNKPVPKSPYFALPGQEAVVETLTVLPEVEVETLAPRSQGGEIIRRALHDCPSHYFFTENEIQAIINQALNGLYPGTFGAEPQTSTDTRLEAQQRQMPQQQMPQQQMNQQQMNQQQMPQQQISQPPFNGAVTPTVVDPSAFFSAPQAYPLSHQLCQNPSALASFAPTPRVVPQTNAQTQMPCYGAPFVDTTAFAPPPQHRPQMSPPAGDIETGPPVPFYSAPGPVASETSPASQAMYNSSLHDVNDGAFDGTRFPAPNPSGVDVYGFHSLEGNGLPTNNGLNNNGYTWRSNNSYQDPNRGYSL